MKLPQYILEDRYLYYSLPWLWLAYVMFVSATPKEAILAVLLCLVIYHVLKAWALRPILRKRPILRPHQEEALRNETQRQMISKEFEDLPPHRIEDLENRNITRYTPTCCFGKLGFGTRCHRPATKRTVYHSLPTEMVWCSDHYPQTRGNGYELIDLPSHPETVNIP